MPSTSSSERSPSVLRATSAFAYDPPVCGFLTASKRCSTRPARLSPLVGNDADHPGGDLVEPGPWREAHGLGDGLHLLVAGVLYAAPAKIRDVRAGHDTTRRLGELLARPPAAVRPTVGIEQAFKLL
jgi:hypothetical protein